MSQRHVFAVFAALFSLLVLVSCGQRAAGSRPALSSLDLGQLASVTWQGGRSGKDANNARSSEFPVKSGSYWVAAEVTGKLIGDPEQAHVLAEVSVEGGMVAFVRFEGKRLTPHYSGKNVVFGTLSARTRVADLRRQDETFIMLTVREIRGFEPSTVKLDIVLGQGDLPPKLKEFVERTERSWWSRYSDFVWIVLIGGAIAGYFVFRTFKPNG